MTPTKTVCYISILLFGLMTSCGKKLLSPKKTVSFSILTSFVSEEVEVLQGTRNKIFLSAIDNHLEKVRFTANDLPPFITLKDFKNGNSELIIDAPKKQDGLFPIQIKVQNGKNSSILAFRINIKKTIGRIFYCDPNKQKNTGDGTYDNPFSSLENLMTTEYVPPSGAIFLLLSGFHGTPVIQISNITIAAASKHNPKLGAIEVKAAKSVTLSGLTIGAIKKSDKMTYLITIDSLSPNIIIQNCLVQSSDNTKNWTVEDWKNKAQKGILCQSKNGIIQDNLIRNIFHGLQTENENIKIQYNTIDRFSGDGIRNISNNNIYANNLIKNAVVDDYSDPKGNHDDLFQSWTFDKPVENIFLKNNIAISFIEPDLPLKSRVVQGLTCFDGFENNWAIEGNIVVTDHPHGIALYGAKNCKVIHNTVLRHPLKLFQFESDPWIMINNHKDGRKSSQNTVDSNIVSALNMVATDVKVAGNQVIDSNNIHYLVDYEGWDFRLISKEKK